MYIFNFYIYTVRLQPNLWF